MTKYLDSLMEKGVPSVDCVIQQDHKVIYHHMAGTTDENFSKKIQGNELYLMFSMTKVQTMASIMQLIERGKLSLEDYVGDYLPAYKNLKVEVDGKVTPLLEPLKIKHLISMQSGLDYDLTRPGILRVLQEKGQMASTREIVDGFVDTPLKFVPGEHFCYSLSHDVAAAIIEVISGMRFGEYLKENLWKPLHMEQTFFAKPMNEVEGLATQFIYDWRTKTSKPMEPSCNYQLSENYESGGAGLISCMKDYAAFADTFACGGTSKEGVQIIKPETIDLMRTNLLCEQSRLDLERTMGRIGYGYGCGVQILLDTERVKTKAPAGIFGWDGAAGSCIIMDPMNHISLVYMQHVRDCGFAYGEIHPTLRNLLYE